MPSSFNIVLSSALVCSTSPPVSVWGTVYTLELFPGTPTLPIQSDKDGQLSEFVTSSRFRNINLIPIDYGFRPRLRGRLTLRGLALRRNPWAFGESVSHTLCRYSCQHSHSPYLQRASRHAFAGLGDAPLPPQESRIGNRGSQLASRPHTVRHSRRFGIRPARPRLPRTNAPRYPIPDPWNPQLRRAT